MRPVSTSMPRPRSIRPKRTRLSNRWPDGLAVLFILLAPARYQVVDDAIKEVARSRQVIQGLLPYVPLKSGDMALVTGRVGEPFQQVAGICAVRIVRPEKRAPWQ